MVLSNGYPDFIRNGWSYYDGGSDSDDWAADIHINTNIDPTDASGDGHQECYQPWLFDKYPSAFLLQMKVARHTAPNYNPARSQFLD